MYMTTVRDVDIVITRHIDDVFLCSCIYLMHTMFCRVWWQDSCITGQVITSSTWLTACTKFMTKARKTLHGAHLLTSDAQRHLCLQYLMDRLDQHPKALQDLSPDQKHPKVCRHWHVCKVICYCWTFRSNKWLRASCFFMSVWYLILVTFER